MSIVKYEPHEINRIRDIISGHLTEEFKTKGGLSLDELATSMVSLIKSNAEGTTADKIETDPHVEKYSFYRFFPVTENIIYYEEKGKNVVFYVNTDTKSPLQRAHYATFQSHANQTVIKSAKNAKENRIAALMADETIGPVQLPTIDNFITEEYHDGIDFMKFVTKLKAEPFGKKTEHSREKKRGIQGDLFLNRTLTPNAVRTVKEMGHFAGRYLKTMHDADIIYNDSILGDNTMKGHFIIPHTYPLSRPLIVDFGLAVETSNKDAMDKFSDAELFNLALGQRGVYQDYKAIPRASMDKQEIFRLQALNAMLKLAYNQGRFIRNDLNNMMYQLEVITGEMKTDIRTPFMKGFYEAYPQAKKIMQSINQ